MKDLHNVFQSWYLAMAAYNAGEGRILGAIMRAKTRVFWEMVKMRALPDETMNYIPKFLAATIIGHNPKKYGFEDIKPETMPTLVSVAVPSPIRLSDIATTTGIPLGSLRDYNPHLLHGMTPPGVKTYRIWLPKDDAESVEEQNDELASLRVKSVRMPRATASGSDDRPRYHTVAAGDSLAKIAARYGVSVKQLKRLNHLRSGRIFAGTRLTLWSSSHATAKVKRYKVQRGDNLNTLARRFGLTVEDLKKLNRLKRTKLYIGQVLKVGTSEKG
jgi:membrane-bound lytic murein transglycosylase D